MLRETLLEAHGHCVLIVMRLTMLLDLAYAAVGIASLTVFWLFVKACDRL